MFASQTDVSWSAVKLISNVESTRASRVKSVRDRNVPVDFLEVLSCEVLLFQWRNGKYIFADIRCESKGL